MALIKCPECEKEVSDKALNCIHCGYPLQSNNVCKVNGIEYDLRFLLDDSIDYFSRVGKLIQISGSSFPFVCDAVAEIVTNNKIPLFLNLPLRVEENVPKCPTCKSVDIDKISAITRIASTGFFGLGSKKIGKTYHCNNCGYEW